MAAKKRTPEDDEGRRSELKRLYCQLEDVIEEAWDKGRLPWTREQYARIMGFVFPSIFNCPPKQRKLWDEAKAEIDADRFAESDVDD